MEDKSILVEKRESICTVTINRGQKQNTLTMEVLRLLIDAIRRIDSDLSTRVVVLRGAGEKVFCAGYDLSTLPAEVQKHSDRMARGRKTTPQEDITGLAVETLADCRCPIIAMIYGPSVGFGCDIAMACDMRLAAHTARFAVPAARRGGVYPPESIRRLINLVGAVAATELLLTGDFIDAGRAREIGLVNRVVDAGDLEEATYSLAGTVAANGPLSLSATKKIIGRHLRARRLTPADDEEVQRLAMQCADSADFQEGVRAFLEKRQPRFQGR